MTASVLEQVSHRPFPLPQGPWAHAQRWEDLLFAHWPVRRETLRALVPGSLPLDTFGGSAWVGIVPFRLRGLRPRGLPPLPGVSSFPEVNVRTYTTLDDRPGVFFFSLDAASALSVLGARLAFRLPYFHAAMDARQEGDGILYRSRRARNWLGSGRGFRLDAAPDGDLARAELVARYRPIGPAGQASPGSLEYFLTERYCLYTGDRQGRVYRVDIHHPPWRLEPAEADFEVNTMAEAAGIVRPDVPPLLHFSRRQDVVGWLPERVRQRVRHSVRPEIAPTLAPGDATP